MNSCRRSPRIHDTNCMGTSTWGSHREAAEPKSNSNYNYKLQSGRFLKGCGQVIKSRAFLGIVKLAPTAAALVWIIESKGLRLNYSPWLLYLEPKPYTPLWVVLASMFNGIIVVGGWLCSADGNSSPGGGEGVCGNESAGNCVSVLVIAEVSRKFSKCRHRIGDNWEPIVVITALPWCINLKEAETVDPIAKCEWVNGIVVRVSWIGNLFREIQCQCCASRKSDMSLIRIPQITKAPNFRRQHHQQ